MKFVGHWYDTTDHFFSIHSLITTPLYYRHKDMAIASKLKIASWIMASLSMK